MSQTYFNQLKGTTWKEKQKEKEKKVLVWNFCWHLFKSSSQMLSFFGENSSKCQKYWTRFSSSLRWGVEKSSLLSLVAISTAQVLSSPSRNRISGFGFFSLHVFFGGCVRQYILSFVICIEDLLYLWVLLECSVFFI